jgi:hypothetical protein
MFTVKESAGAVLRRCTTTIIEGWLARAKQIGESSLLLLSDAERTMHLPTLVDDLVFRLKASPTVKALPSASAVHHGEVRYLQGYTPPMLVDESRILQVTLFETLHTNLNAVDFRLLLPGVVTIADEVDSQLSQAVDSYMKVMNLNAAAGVLF